MSKMIKFPKIGQFRNVVKRVREACDFQGLDGNEKPIYRHESDYPSLKFTGTVKLHGTNAAIAFNDDGIHVQSRTRIITEADDNAGFAAFVGSLPQNAMDIMEKGGATVFGEWCGGNIQSGVAINGLPKMFAIFAHRKGGEWVDLPYSAEEESVLSDNGIFLMRCFAEWSIVIDFNSPEEAQNKICALVDAVERECPAGKYLGVSGTGEGIVWKCSTDPSSELWFKTKGEKHSATKVKTLSAVDVEKAASVNDFVEMTVTDNRLSQGIESMKEMGLPIEMKSTGDYMRWVITDILKEESDTMEASGLVAKDVGGAISKKAKVFWFAEVNKF